jgi:hypothetical protein
LLVALDDRPREIAACDHRGDGGGRSDRKTLGLPASDDRYGQALDAPHSRRGVDRLDAQRLAAQLVELVALARRP